MTRTNLEFASTTDLIDQLTELLIQEGKVLDAFYIDMKEQTADYNRICSISYPIQRELAARGPEAERQLLPLLEHSNPWVRKNAAGQLLPLEETKARAALEKIIAGAHNLAAILPRARLTLGYWEDGTYTGIRPARGTRA